MARRKSVWAIGRLRPSRVDHNEEVGMSDYMKLVAEVAAVHRDDICGDLDHTRHRLRLAHGEAA